MKKVLLVGANGYGVHFVRNLFRMHQEGQLTFAGVVTRSAFPLQEELAAAGIPSYKSLDAFYAECSADLALISTPSFMHREQSIYCLEHGSYVLCEKPAAPTMEDVDAMLQAEKETGKFIAIGFQRCFSPVILQIKQDILSGMFGKPLSAKYQASNCADFAYYSRGGGYAGNVATKDGKIILDSPVANARAHNLQEMLFLLGEEMDTVAEPTLVQGECYRANDITNFDTCFLKLTVRDNVSVYFNASHAVEPKTPVTAHFEFENAVLDFAHSEMVATFKDGRVIQYGRSYPKGTPDEYTVKIVHCLEAIEKGTSPVCTVKTARAHVQVINEIHKRIPVVTFPKEEIVYLEDHLYVNGLHEKMLEAYEKTCMLSEL